MNDLPIIKHVRLAIRGGMAKIAPILYKLSGGKLTANTVTWIGVIAHIPICYLVAIGEFWWAIPLLIIFGLLDALDGALARASGQASPAGMVLDAFTDRLKETMMHSAAAYFLAMGPHPALAVIPVIALGFSLSTNYLKAKAEVAYQVKHPGKKTLYEINTLFSDGALSFEVRTLVFIVGLAFGTPKAVAIAEAIIAIGVWQAPHHMRAILKAVRAK